MILWSKFVDESPHGTIFSNYHYLHGSGVRYKTYFVFRGEQIKCGLALTLNDNEEEINIAPEIELSNFGPKVIKAGSDLTMVASSYSTQLAHHPKYYRPLTNTKGCL